MLKNYVPVQYYEKIEYEVVFDDGCYNGFGFPCDEDGNLPEDLNDAAKENYKYCMDHPEKFERYNKVIARKYRVRDDAHGTCSCGHEVQLYDAYYGACQCDKCGKWYNLFGQELLPPENWEHDPSEEEYWDW